MKSKHSRAFTKIDLLIVMATVAMLAIWAVYGPTFRAKPGSKRINCTSNLKQIGLGFRMWSNDHGEQFPWQVPEARKSLQNSPPLRSISSLSRTN
jgi:hypothetical protein